MSLIKMDRMTTQLDCVLSWKTLFGYENLPEKMQFHLLEVRFSAFTHSKDPVQSDRYASTLNSASS